MFWFPITSALSVMLFGRQLQYQTEFFLHVQSICDEYSTVMWAAYPLCRSGTKVPFARLSEAA